MHIRWSHSHTWTTFRPSLRPPSGLGVPKKAQTEPKHCPSVATVCDHLMCIVPCYHSGAVEHRDGSWSDPSSHYQKVYFSQNGNLKMLAAGFLRAHRIVGGKPWPPGRGISMISKVETNIRSGQDWTNWCTCITKKAARIDYFTDHLMNRTKRTNE